LESAAEKCGDVYAAIGSRENSRKNHPIYVEALFDGTVIGDAIISLNNAKDERKVKPRRMRAS